MLDSLVQPRRNQEAAEAFLHRVLDGNGSQPRVVITDKLASYAPLALKLDKEWARRLTEEHFRATARFCVEAQHDAFAAGDAKRHMEEFLAKRRKKS